jgi:hypothetical protein
MHIHFYRKVPREALERANDPFYYTPVVDWGIGVLVILPPPEPQGLIWFGQQGCSIAGLWLPGLNLIHVGESRSCRHNGKQD